MTDDGNAGTSQNANSKLDPNKGKSFRDTLTEATSWSKENKEKLLAEYDSMKKIIDTLQGLGNKGRQNNTEDEEEDVDENLNDGKGYRLDANTPVYRGRKDENVEQWITIVLNNLRAAGVPKNKSLYVITNYLTEGALSSLIKYQRDTPRAQRSHIEFFKILLERDNNVIRKNVIKNKLMNLRQTGAFDEYLYKFQELANESEMREEDLLLMFSNGLKQRNKFEVMVREPKTLAEAYAIASKFEQCIDRGSNNQDESRLAKVNYVKDKGNSDKNGNCNSDKNGN